MKKQKDFYQISLKVLLKNKKGEILILKAIDGGTFSGFYDLPGGRIDTNEFRVNFDKILKREIKEELGNIKYKLKLCPVSLGRHLIPPKMSDIKKEIHVLYILFEADYINGKIKISDEHKDYIWVNLKKINLKKYFTSGILEGIKAYAKDNK